MGFEMVILIPHCLKWCICEKEITALLQLLRITEVLMLVNSSSIGCLP